MSYIFILFFSLAAQAYEFPPVQSENLVFVGNPKKLQPDGLPKIAHLFASKPKGIPSRASWPKCSPESFEDLILENGRLADAAEILQQRFDECEKHLDRFPALQIWRLLRFAAVKYNMNENRQIQEVRLRNEGFNRKALLGMKDGRRPLIVFQCGLFCDIFDLQTKIIMMHLFDGTPYHVLLIGSVSGKSFLRESPRISIGGFDEAIQLMQTIRILKDPDEPISKYISSIHLVGGSLGSHAVLYSALYASYETNPAIKSAIALCPVVNFRESVHNLSYGNSYARSLGEAALGLFRDKLKTSTDPEIRAMLKWPLSRMPELVENMGLRQARELDWLLPPPLDQYTIRTTDQFWELGEFERFADQVKIPVFAMSSEDDNVVPFRGNIARLSNGPYISTLRSTRGLHCAASAYYGFGLLTSIVSSQIRLHADEYRSSLTEAKIRVPKFASRLNEGETFFSYEWEAREKSMRLTYKIWSPSIIVGSSSKCESWDPYIAFEGCFRRVSVDVPYSKFFGTDLYRPRTDAEAEALTRWANANLRVLDSRGKVLHHTRRRPTHIRWMDNGQRPR